MLVRFAKSYIDRLFEEKDMPGLYHLLGILEKQRQLPEQFWLFCRVYEWAPARSGVWQYYEGLPDAAFERMSQSLDRFGLAEIAQKYRLGKSTWDGPTQATEVDQWLDAHWRQIHDAAFSLIAAQKELLYES